MLTVFVLGHRGMLGHVVTRFLREKGYEVITTDKRFEASHDCQLLREVSLSGADVIVNCIGKIRQKTGDPSELFLANTVLPIQVLQRLSPTQRFVQISSDCVFSGFKEGAYMPNEQPDPIDAYGASKAAGEIVALDHRATVIRTSIIGPEVGSSFGLYAWFVNNPATKVSGYTNHLWNGVTTLQLAKTIESIIRTGPRVSDNIYHEISAPVVSKRDLLLSINEIWDLKKEIISVATPHAVNHTLAPNRMTLPEHIAPHIEQQLEELKEWY
jgi:dTDP-4-dehydrorhamnose reductase